MPISQYEHMSFRKGGNVHVPLKVFAVNGTYVLGVYQGSLSEHDILIRYKQRMPDGSWSRLRTPKHVHWAVDMLIKLHEDEEHTQSFIDFLMNIWSSTTPIQGRKEREDTLEVLVRDVSVEMGEYASLSEHGEYSIKFLLLLAKLLMLQEKTNRRDAYMFGNLLKKLRDGEDIFSIIPAASYNGRR